jgi:starvation-inducible DNA-binding protein
MTDLIQSLKVCLANSFTFYLKVQNYHWNVEGADFFQYHTMFETIYTEVYASIDATAEIIRALDSYAPGTLVRMKDLSHVKEDETIPSTASVIPILITCNNQVLADLFIAYKAAEEASELGISNFIQDRILAHQKHGWFLKACQK